jgi:hypothetical protein
VDPIHSARSIGYHELIAHAALGQPPAAEAAHQLVAELTGLPGTLALRCLQLQKASEQHLGKLRSALRGVQEPAFQYDVDYIVSSMGWQPASNGVRTPASPPSHQTAMGSSPVMLQLVGERRRASARLCSRGEHVAGVLMVWCVAAVACMHPRAALLVASTCQ